MVSNTTQSLTIGVVFQQYRGWTFVPGGFSTANQCFTSIGGLRDPQSVWQRTSISVCLPTTVPAQQGIPTRSDFG